MITNCWLCLSRRKFRLGGYPPKILHYLSHTSFLQPFVREIVFLKLNVFETKKWITFTRNMLGCFLLSSELSSYNGAYDSNRYLERCPWPVRRPVIGLILFLPMFFSPLSNIPGSFKNILYCLTLTRYLYENLLCSPLSRFFDYWFYWYCSEISTPNSSGPI